MEVLEINGRNYPVEVVQALKRTSSVRISNGKVILRLSRHLRGKGRDKTVARFLEWAEKRLSKIPTKDFIEPTYEDGGRVVTHNKIYEIAVFEEDRKNVGVLVREGVFIDVFYPLGQVDQAKLAKLVKREIMKDQMPYLEEVLSELNQLHFGYHYKECCFRDVKSRFGSCSSKGVITIAYRLLFAPREVFRYVCVHELAHLKQFNHSAKFWALVKEAMPGYKEPEKWLRERGVLLG